MVRRWLLIIASLAASGPGRVEARASAPPGPEPVVGVTADGLFVAWSAAKPVFTAQANGRYSVSVPGFVSAGSPGAPEWPVASLLVALPPGAQPALDVLVWHARPLHPPGPLATAPRPEGVERSEEGAIMGGRLVAAADTDWPALPAIELQPLGRVRGVSLARLVFRPVTIADGGLRWTASVEARLRYNAPEANATALAAAPDPVLAGLQRLVVNPSAALPNAAETELAPALSAGAPQVIVEVADAGLTAVTYADLAAAGFPVTNADPRALQMTRAGQTVAVEWDGDDDAQFEPGERLLFYASPRFSRWANFDAYYLTSVPYSGLRMEARSASPAGLAAGSAWVEQGAEVNKLYTPNCYCGSIPPGRDGDRWAWDDLRRPGRPTAAYPLVLANVDTSRPATLTVWLIGYTDVKAWPDHQANVSVNQASVGSLVWDGKLAVTGTLTIPAGVLVSGVNTVTLSLPGLPGAGVEGMWLDAFSIRHARGGAPSVLPAAFSGEAAARAYDLSLTTAAGLRAYDVTDPDQPRRLTGLQVTASGVRLGDTAGAGGRRYVVTSADHILRPSVVRSVSALATHNVTGADYLLIAPSHLASSLTALIDLRKQEGLRVVAEDLQAVYDAHDGRPAPEAIRAFLARAYAVWSPKPAYVLLVGDGTYDPKQYLSDSAATVIPPFLADVDPWAGETAADNRYVAVDGDDSLPDMLIGRLPVNTLAEARTVVDKIVRYAEQPPPGTWNSALIFVADDDDDGGSFAHESEALANGAVPPPFLAHRLYYQPSAQAVAGLQADIVRRWKSGAGLVAFSGHSSMFQWAVERFLHVDDVAALDNGARLPVIVELTCFTGSFHLPHLSALDEALLRHPDGGAIAAWGATGLGVSTGHRYLAQGFIPSLYASGQTLGQAALAGKLHLAAHNPENLDLVDTFTLAGDPALRLNTQVQSWPNTLHLPVISR